MIRERCKVNGCTVEHPSNGSIQLFEHVSYMFCRQCGADSREYKELEERTHVCDVCGETVDVYEEAVKFSVGGSAAQGWDKVEIECHPKCAVNAGATLMVKYTKKMEPELGRGARQPKWWDGLRKLLGLPVDVSGPQ